MFPVGPTGIMERMNKSYPPNTPKPGKRLPAQEETKTIEEFLVRFRKQGTPALKRTWDAFSIPSKLLGTGEMGTLDLKAVSFPDLDHKEDLLIYLETPGHVYRSDIDAIRSYFSTRGPQDDYDLYIFDSQMKWCLAMTHDLPKGIGVFAAGERVHAWEKFMRSAE